MIAPIQITIVSIPIWFDLKYLLGIGERPPPKFQFLYGSI